jgi:hypothetical protein
MAQTYAPSLASSDGVSENAAVDPAPDAPGPYLRDGESDFYHPMARARALQERIEAASNAGRMTALEARSAMRDLAEVSAEAKVQIARHGALRDWDRERLNDMMNHLVQQFPVLAS